MFFGCRSATDRWSRRCRKPALAFGPCYEQLQEALPRTSVHGNRRDGAPRARPRPVELVLPRAWPGPLHVVPHRPVAGIEGVEAIPGRGVWRDHRLRLLLGLSEVSARDQRVAAIVLGAPDPRREVPDHAAGSGRRAATASGCWARSRRLFRVWHRRGQTPDARWQRAIAKGRGEVLAVARRAPTRTEAQNMAKRFRDHGDAYFTFLDTPGIEPTNNGPERQIRFLAIDRKITQGTRGEAGRRWCERIWTIAGHLCSARPFRLRVHLPFDRRLLHRPTLPLPPASTSVTDQIPILAVAVEDSQVPPAPPPSPRSVLPPIPEQSGHAIDLQESKATSIHSENGLAGRIV